MTQEGSEARCGCASDDGDGVGRTLARPGVVGLAARVTVDLRSTKRKARGALKRAIARRTGRGGRRGVGVPPGSSCTIATTSWPNRGSARPTTSTSHTRRTLQRVLDLLDEHLLAARVHHERVAAQQHEAAVGLHAGAVARHRNADARRRSGTSPRWRRGRRGSRAARGRRARATRPRRRRGEEPGAVGRETRGRAELEALAVVALRRARRTPPRRSRCAVAVTDHHLRKVLVDLALESMLVGAPPVPMHGERARDRGRPRRAARPSGRA